MYAVYYIIIFWCISIDFCSILLCPLRDDQELLDLELAMRDGLLKIASYDGPRPKEPAKCSFQVNLRVMYVVVLINGHF